MTEAEVQQLKALIVATSAYYGHQIPPAVLALYAEDLADLPLSEVARAIKEVRRDPKTARFPLPAVIRARIEVAPTDDDQVQDAVSRIIEAVAKHGWNNSEAAKKHIGELGWAIVTRDGGWTNVCEYLSQDNLGTARAQWRQLGMSLCRSSRSGTLRLAPALPAPSNSDTHRIQDMSRLVTHEIPKEPA